MLLEEGVSPNDHLLGYWRRLLTIVQDPRLLRLLKPLEAEPSLRYSLEPYAVAINETARYASIQAAWHGKGPLLKLTERDIERGTRRLEQMGVPAGAWFVGVHCREAGYVKDEHHDFRDADINSYVPAMKAIVARGGWCIRLGDPTMKPLAPIPNVVDYVHSPYRSDWMDVFLCARARFLLGSSSGLVCLGSIFGVPSALANLAPMSLLSYGVEDLNIPKLVVSKADGRYLSFSEVFGSPVGNFRYTHLYENAGLGVEDNSAEDILQLAMEMADRCDGIAAYTAEDEELQRRFKSLFRPGHFAHGAAVRVGRDFLRKYAYLFG